MPASIAARPIPAASDPAAPAAAVELNAERTVAVLSSVLDDLGAAHHRPFSRE
jgi:hypothetical protein